MSGENKYTVLQGGKHSGRKSCFVVSNDESNLDVQEMPLEKLRATKDELLDFGKE